LFPIYACMVSCAQRSKNLERYLVSNHFPFEILDKIPWVN
jgi:hypothetical protein